MIGKRKFITLAPTPVNLDNEYIVNGTKGKDAFTCVSSRGSSVVDYCIVPGESQSMIEEFKVVTIHG